MAASLLVPAAMDTSPKVELSMLRTETLVDASALKLPAQAYHEPSWLPVAAAVALLLWALNWRRGKPGLVRALLRQMRR